MIATAIRVETSEECDTLRRLAAGYPRLLDVQDVWSADGVYWRVDDGHPGIGYWRGVHLLRADTRAGGEAAMDVAATLAHAYGGHCPFCGVTLAESECPGTR